MRKLLLKFTVIIPPNGRQFSRPVDVPDQDVLLIIDNEEENAFTESVKNRKVSISAPQKFWGQRLEVCIFAIAEQVVSTSPNAGLSVSPSQAAPAPVPTPQNTYNGIRRVYSGSIGDMSAFGILNVMESEGINPQEFEIYTGAGWGALLGMLFALDMPIERIKTGLMEEGVFIAKAGITKPVRVLAKITDPRNSFGHLLNFLRWLVPDLPHLKLRDLNGDFFYRMLNIKTNTSSILNKATAPDLPLETMAYCIMATFQDYEDLVIKKKDCIPEIPAFSQPGNLWNMLSTGEICPDQDVATHYDFSNLAFRTFVRPYLPSVMKGREIKKFWTAFPHLMASEIAFNFQSVNTIETMVRIPTIQYVPSILPETVWNSEYSASEIEAQLATRPRLIDQF